MTPTPPPIETELRAASLAATQAVFAATGVSCIHSGTAEAPFLQAGVMIASSIGFASEELRGSLVVLAPAAIARALAPDEPPTDTVACDVVGEFANMIVGRIKTRLLRLDVKVLIGTPTSAIAERISIPSRSNAPEGGWHSFVIAGGYALHVRVDALADPAFEFRAPGGAGTSDAPNGNVTLF